MTPQNQNQQRHTFSGFSNISGIIHFRSLNSHSDNFSNFSFLSLSSKLHQASQNAFKFEKNNKQRKDRLPHVIVTKYMIRQFGDKNISDQEVDAQMLDLINKKDQYKGQLWEYIKKTGHYVFDKGSLVIQKSPFKVEISPEIKNTMNETYKSLKPQSQVLVEALGTVKDQLISKMQMTPDGKKNLEMKLDQVKQKVVGLKGKLKQKVSQLLIEGGISEEQWELIRENRKKNDNFL